MRERRLIVDSLDAVCSVVIAKLSVACISGQTLIQTGRGEIPLCEVQPGDWVLGECGTWHRVVNKDFGFAPDCGRFLKLVAETVSVTASEDHVVGGRPMREWRVGDMIPTYVGEERVTEIRGKARGLKVAYAGDLLLENGHCYVANGIVCDSMIAQVETCLSS